MVEQGKGFINESGLSFSDISSETKREYLLFTPEHPLKIDGKPLKLHVSKSGGHRIYTDTYCYYVQPKEGWAVRWQTGGPHFVK